MADRRIFTRLNSFRDHLRNAGLKPSSISRYISIVKRFYRFFDVDVPSVRVGGHGRNPAFDRLPKRSEIKAAISYAKPLYRAMMLLQVSSGMGASEVSNLSLDQFVEAIGLDVFDLGVDECIELVERENVVGVWRVRRQKTRRQYVTFSTPEANIAILEYLRERVDFENWRLFAGLKTGRVGTDVYAHYLAGLNDRLGLGSFDGRRILSSHNLRRFFATQLYSQGMDKMMIEWLLGHKVNDVDSAYYKFDVKSALEEYRRHMGALLIEKRSVRVGVEKRRVKELAFELKEKEERIRELEDEIEYVRGLVLDLRPLYEAIKRDDDLRRRLRKTIRHL